MSIKQALCAAAVVTVLAGNAPAQSLQSTLDGHAMFGINRNNGNLVRYKFGDQPEVGTVGTVRDADQQALLGIDAAAYFPGFQNIFALWTGSDYKNRLVYVDITTAQGTVVADDLEGGKFTGAVAFNSEAVPFTVFAVQAAKIKPPSTITGLLNLNPNNVEDNEFQCTRGDGASFSRYTLHNSPALTADGTYYEGAATFVHVKPKGNGNQNGLIINGEEFALKNSNTYSFSGDMQVRVYNDNYKNGKAMGHWWIQIVSGTVHINNDVQVLTPNRLASVDQHTGSVTEIMTLQRTYKGLSTLDGKTFYTTNGGNLYKINTTAGTEDLVGSLGTLNTASDVKHLNGYMWVYDTGRTHLGAASPDTGAVVINGVDLNAGALGPIMFTPLPDLTMQAAVAFD